MLCASSEIVEGERIIDVAFRYGWSYHAGFTKDFKKEFGKSGTSESNDPANGSIRRE